MAWFPPIGPGRGNAGNVDGDEKPVATVLRILGICFHVIIFIFKETVTRD
jgi:hypothetical protein